MVVEHKVKVTKKKVEGEIHKARIRCEYGRGIGGMLRFKKRQKQIEATEQEVHDHNDREWKGRREKDRLQNKSDTKMTQARTRGQAADPIVTKRQIDPRNK